MDKKNQSTLPVGFRTTINTLHPLHNVGTNLTQIFFGLSVLALAALLSACTASTNNSTPTPTTVIAQINLPAPTATPVPTNVEQVATAPASLDPCVLIDSQEASSYAGASAGVGNDLPV